MDYEVNFTKQGRGGSVYYLENGKNLPFEWDTSSVGFDIYVPRPTGWQAFCIENKFDEAISRREEIVQRVAEEVKKKRARKAKVEIDEFGIHFSFEGDWLFSLLGKILGV
jgi:hypothetical protein